MRKSKGGGGESKSHKIDYFFGLTEISGRFPGRGPRKLAEWNFLTQLTTNFCGFEFGSKEKKLDSFKVREWRSLKNKFHPPPPSKVNVTRPPLMFWHVTQKAKPLLSSMSKKTPFHPKTRFSPFSVFSNDFRSPPKTLCRPKKFFPKLPQQRINPNCLIMS